MLPFKVLGVPGLPWFYSYGPLLLLQGSARVRPELCDTAVVAGALGDRQIQVPNKQAHTQQFILVAAHVSPSHSTHALPESPSNGLSVHRPVPKITVRGSPCPCEQATARVPGYRYIRSHGYSIVLHKLLYVLPPIHTYPIPAVCSTSWRCRPLPALGHRQLLGDVPQRRARCCPWPVLATAQQMQRRIGGQRGPAWAAWPRLAAPRVAPLWPEAACEVGRMHVPHLPNDKMNCKKKEIYNAKTQDLYLGFAGSRCAARASSEVRRVTVRFLAVAGSCSLGATVFLPWPI